MDDVENVTDVAGSAAPDQGSVTADEVTTLRSRVSGYTAKINEMSTSNKALAKERDELRARLDEFQRGAVDKDEALRAVASEKDAEINRLLREAALARIEAKYPETFSVLGEAAVNLSAEALAEAEARFRGVSAEQTVPPKPIGNNPPRTQGGASSAQTNPEGETLAQLRKRVFSMNPMG